MSWFPKSYAWIPKLFGAIAIILVLCIFFTLYFYRYLPAQQQLFNGRAFRELEQIGNGLQSKNEGYFNAVLWFLKQHSASNPLHGTFQFTKPFPAKPDSFYAGAMLLKKNAANAAWQLDYPIYSASDSAPTTEMYIPLSHVIQPIITTYRDIFTNYLVFYSSEIAFSSGTLPANYTVDLDSMVKKDDGFNLITIHDITIEGTPYKLFLYPLQIGKEKIILAGILDSASYTKGYNTLPLNMVVLIGALVILLIMHLPILKIFVLSRTERIRAFDMRMIIVTYFLAAFLVFFLFSRLFLNHVQSMHSYLRLQDLSTKIENGFTTEIDQICRQLRQWDSGDADSVHAEKYPYGDYVYWIDSTGKWVDAWSLKRRYRAEFLDVHDRAYFKDFMQHNLLTLSGRNPPDSFTIQPTLSRLDGEYTINVLIRSHPRANRNSRIVGLSTEMYSVDNALLPFGYNFSIIDKQGNILYDSKPGRALLSNITRETESASDLLAPLRFHSKRYFSSFIMQGKPHALLVTPMKGLPYALLVYYDLTGSDDFQEHLLWLPAFFGAATLLLLILSALIKEQSEKRSMLLRTPTHRFEWLQPTRNKRKYYIHVCRSLAGFMLLFFVIWIILEWHSQPQEFSLFFISLLFPFYVALNYSLVREKQKDALNLPLLTFLGLVIVAINLFASLGARSPFLPLLWSQLAFIGAMILSVRSFHREKPVEPPKKWLRYYVIAIVAGIVAINILPISSIFWVVFRQESLVQSNTARLILAGNIDDRRTIVNQRIADYKLSPAHRQDSADLHRLKFQYGVYTLSTDTITTQGPEHKDTAWPIAPAYTQIHRWLFPGDTTALAWPANPNYSTDSSWVFLRSGNARWPGPGLLYCNQRDAIDLSPELVESNATDSYSAFRLMLHETFTEASHFYSVVYFGSIALILALLLLGTYAMTKRIYLLDLIRKDFPDRQEPDPEMVALNKQEKQWFQDPVANEQLILKSVEEQRTRYSTIWNSLGDLEKFTLYDFALDGFTNYKNTDTLIRLINRNILIIDGECLIFMTPGFREWVLRQSKDPAFLHIDGQQGKWQTTQQALLILLAIPGLFIFITQNDIYQKITGAVTALAPLLPLIKSFFPKKEDHDL